MKNTNPIYNFILSSLSEGKTQDEIADILSSNLNKAVEERKAQDSRADDAKALLTAFTDYIKKHHPQAKTLIKQLSAVNPETAATFIANFTETNEDLHRLIFNWF